MIKDSFNPDHDSIKYMDYQESHDEDSDATPVTTNKTIDMYLWH